MRDNDQGSQCEQIREYLMTGREIDPRFALLNFGCFRLAARIKDLRTLGMKIKTEMVEADGKRFASYKWEQRRV